ncbi:hypothetical protein LUZ60_011508 [Juncus effusus]|nr:hypothetical protein LUZ60_011508 [Juncus effusus]
MEGGDDLLVQLETVLESDDLIDEIGFIHPTQFESLDSNSDSNHSQFSNEHFWNKAHKLAISSQILSRLYKSAIKAHSNARKSFKIRAESSIREKYSSVEKYDSDESIEKDLLRHSKSLVILSPNFLTAWNSRKLVLSKEDNINLCINELRPSNLVLSYAPKSESAWSHRRWVIKFIADKFQNLEEIITNESELVKNICEKFKMNYRAWNHRCWLVNYMTKQQVLEELNKSRKWAEMHISDNSCFHFRTVSFFNYFTFLPLSS